MSLGHEVVYSVPKTALSKLKANDSSLLAEIKELEKLSFDGENQAKVLAEVDPDVIICGHWPAVQLKFKPSQILIIDLAGPHILERHYQNSPAQQDAILAKCSVLNAADGIIVSGKKQAKYFESYLARAKRLDLIDKSAQIFMPLPPENSLSKIKNEDYPKFIFGGVFLPWQDPSHALKTTLEYLESNDVGKLLLVGGKHPHYEVDVGLYDKLFESLKSSKKVESYPMLPYEEFIKKIAISDVALDLMSWNLERELAVTIRSSTYLWSGTPVIYNDYSDLSELIKKYNAGWTVPPDNTEALNSVLSEITSLPELVKEKSKNALLLAKENFSWTESGKALVELVSKIESSPREALNITTHMADSAIKGPSQNKSLKQKFLTRGVSPTRVSVRLTTKGKKLTSIARIKLLGGSNEQVYEINPGISIDDEWYSLEIPLTVGTKDKLEICLESEAEEPEIFPWLMHATPYPFEELRFGDEVIKHSCFCMKTYHHI